MAWKERLARLTVVALALAFAGAFAVSIRDVTGNAALLPRGAIAAILVVAAWNVIAELRAPAPPTAAAPAATTVWRGLGVVAAAFGLVILAPRLGFYPAAAIFSPTVMVMLGMRNPLRIGLATGALLGITYVIFTLLLNIRLP